MRGSTSRSQRVSNASELLEEGTENMQRDAVVVFAVVVVCVVVYHMYIGRRIWFTSDEWDFLAARRAWNLGDLFRPHTDEHWSLVPILIWRGLWNVVGLRSYAPYQALSVGSHAAIGVMLRVIMRRSGVGPWLATLVATIYLLFGTGADDIVWAFQVNFNLAIGFALGQLLLADHSGSRVTSRDLLGVVAGFLALMSAAPAVPFIAITALVLVVKRGWRIAAFHVVPLAVVFVAWWFAFSRPHTSFDGSVATSWSYTRSGLSSTFRTIEQVPYTGWILVVVLVAGTVLAIRAANDAELRSRLVVPYAMAIGSVAFLGFVSSGRITLSFVQAVPSRYLDILAVTLLPAIAVAVDALFAYRRFLGIGSACVLLIGIPGNIQAGNRISNQWAARGKANELIVKTIGAEPAATHVPSDLRPDPAAMPDVTIGWILAGVRSGKIPQHRSSDTTVRATNALRLAIMQREGTESHECTRLTRPLVHAFAPGATLGIRDGGVYAQAVADDGSLSIPVRYGTWFLAPSRYHELRFLRPIVVRFSPQQTIGSGPAFVCWNP